ncbi:MAG: hypothetical protein IKB62_05115 [Oscillospiraceae bacterium]|nr:hypothetical protein [Oscillospiraceae bacterium]
MGHEIWRPHQVHELLVQNPTTLFGEILRLTEGDLAPVSCLECSAQPCQHTADCRTRPMWLKLQAVINNYLDSVTLDDLLCGNVDGVL